ncbi:NAD(+) synthase [Pelobacter propionicus]|uniref:NH(3)-dependent NAD(+) synthetase n=1 Tax=Pelobacter propionicus (strain DSM 2379 / NBRC 103807 / OttBd1) TaxID=338966 RepID=A1ASZ5_PELPD|nr:NAD(+) synthase [Pelobacter propionicus]ABL00466.1 NH(3)-dependent NAD(+) synthetase [Pelobacter propionicus DSM 2379]
MNGTVHHLREALRLNPDNEASRISREIREMMLGQIKRRGLVVGLSGGIDSSVTAALAVKALGQDRVLGLLMPERNSSGDSLHLGKMVAGYLGIETVTEEITNILEVVGFYQKYDSAVCRVIPEYGRGWKSKIVISNALKQHSYASFYIVAQPKEGAVIKKRLSLEPYLEIVAATNFKQRIRKMLEYYHADRLNYAVAGTPNRLEYDQGFFVKLGDGAADIKPIAHLYKSQVYQLAEYFGIPEEIRQRKPTTDTYSLEQGQDEFFFTLPYDQMDLCLFGKNNSVPAGDIANALGMPEQHIEIIYKDIDTKRATTRYLHLSALVMENGILSYTA